MNKFTSKEKHAFTLTELLVVISIIAVLAGLLLPALMTAQDEAKLAACMNNLKQFGIAIENYRNDFNGNYPPWLSTTDIQEVPGLFVCPFDGADGAEGARPDWITGIPSGPTSQYAETNDMPVGSFSATDKDPSRLGSIEDYFDKFSLVSRLTEGYRGDNVNRCSYLYEFNQEIVSWGKSGSYTGYYETLIAEGYDTDPNWNEIKKPWEISNKPTWLYAKKFDFLNFPDKQSYVPMVRCFYHIPEDGQGRIKDEIQPRKNVPALRYDYRVDMCYPCDWWKD